MAKRPVIKVPRPQRSSYRPDRPLAKKSLLANQVEHFRALEKELPEEHQTGVVHETITTEGRAAAYIRSMTEKLHQLSTKEPKE